MVDSVGTDSALQLPQAALGGAPRNLRSVLKFQGLDGNGLKYDDGIDPTSPEVSSMYLVLTSSLGSDLASICPEPHVRLTAPVLFTCLQKMRRVLQK